MTSLPSTNIGQAIKAAAAKLALAATAGEVLEARDMAALAYDAAKRAARLQKAKRAHDDIIAATHRAQADALEIEALAKRRLADEYDAAQDRGEVVGRKGGGDSTVPSRNAATAADLGLKRKDVHEARQVRDAIAKNPTIVREALDDILASGDEPTRTALKRAIAPAVKTLRTEAQAEKKERRATREVELAAKQAALPAKRYGVIYADPEWRFDPYSTETGMDRSPDNHYPTSDLLALMRRDVGALAAKDCVLFLWATAPMLVEAICVLDAWGFAWIERDATTGFLSPNKAHARYVSHWTWLKNRIATGYWNRGKHEILLIATRGNPVAPAMGDQLDSWCDDMAVQADVGRHSAKPAVFAEWIEKHWPNTPKIELNARAPRPGWDAWGNEAIAEAKASEDNGGTSAAIGDPMTGEVSRPDAGRSASATSEIMDATAGETAPNSKKRGFGDALVEWAELRKLEARADLTPEEIARRDFLKPIVEADLAPVEAPAFRPSISADEKSEFDLLAAIARGEKGEGPLFESLNEQGLIWAGRELSVGGAKRLAELGRLIDVADEVPA